MKIHLTVLTILLILIFNSESSVISEHFRCGVENDNLKSMIKQIVEEVGHRSDCAVFVTDSIYRRLINVHDIDTPNLLSKYEISIRDNQGFSQPNKRLKKILIDSKSYFCNLYVVLIANGLQASEFFKWAEDQRLINAQGYFIILHDHRLFIPDLHYLWKRIINVVFIRRYNSYKRRLFSTKFHKEPIDLDTVLFPPPEGGFLTTKYIDTWYRGEFRHGNQHFPIKTEDLQKKFLRVAIFEHIPATTESSRNYYKGGPSCSEKALGIEFELLRIITQAMNFHALYYMPYNITAEKWGTIDQDNESYTGLLAEAVNGRADFYLGDLHYTMRHLRFFDLSFPYNTECLTFLTPESLTDKSWKLLVLPFRFHTWLGLLFTLFFGGISIHLFALCYQKYIIAYKNIKTNDSVDISINETRGLYLFIEPINGFLYTYGMILQVSLPRLPDPWPIRVFIGWWWLYSILVSVAYRASMTAVLANPVSRITIDSINQLAESSLEVGGWSDEYKDFFQLAFDKYSQKIGDRFEVVEKEDEAIDRVIKGSFAYYENWNTLQTLRVKRQILEDEKQKNHSYAKSHNLHIMTECVVNMPIALGMNKNSPLKPYVDLWITRAIEVGLVDKWLSDVMEWSKITEIRRESEGSKAALVDLYKLQGAFLVLGIGYFSSGFILVGEILYWKYVVLKNPKFDKYHLDVFYKTI